VNSTDLFNAFRSDVRDEVTPYLWSNADLTRYANAAQIQFCKLEGGISDSSSAATQVTVTAGEAFSPLHASILKVRHARRLSDGRELELLNLEDVQMMHAQPSDYGSLTSYTAMNTIGALRGMVLGMELNKARWVYIPVANDTVQLTINRKPLEAITGSGQDLEIEEDHHEYLLLWMKYMAHLKQDAETYDKGRSDNFKTQFEDYCRQAKTDRERREHKFRTMSYGGY